MTRRKKAEIILFCTTFIWAGTFVVIKLALPEVSAFLFVAIRFAFAAVVFFLVFWRRLLVLRRSAIWKGAVLGFLIGIGLALQTVGLEVTTASKSAFITGMMVVFTPVAQIYLERRLPKPGNIIGIIIVTAGLYLLTSPSGGGFNWGDLVTVIASLLFGAYIVLLDIYTKEEEFLSIAFLQIFFTAIFAWFFVPFEDIHLSFGSGFWVGILYTGILATVITTYIGSKYQKETTPTRAAILYTFEPVLSSIIAYFVLDEVLGFIGIVGAVLIIAGILVSELSDIYLKRLHWKSALAEEE